MGLPKEKFTSQASPEVLTIFKQITKNEGRKLQSMPDEAMRDLIVKKRSGKVRRHVVEAFSHSLTEFDTLYKELAKSS